MSLRFLSAGESHGPALLVILEGIPAGLRLSVDIIDRELVRRQHGAGAGPRMKLEHDQAWLLSGVMEGVTTGAPLAIQISNQDHVRWKAKEITAFTTPRPGHADLVGAVKFGYQDLRPAIERASARETAARVAAGAVCKELLSQFHIQVGGYVTQIGEISANLDAIPLVDRIRWAEQNEVHCPDPQAAQAMSARIRQVMQERDTLGGMIEVLVLGAPPGLGSYIQWDRRLDGRLGAAILSIPAIKGVEIGPAFANAGLTGTQVHDPIRLDQRTIVRTSNRAGGIEGGVTNGMPVVLRAAMKPIATTLTPQETVDLATGQETTTRYERSDFCPTPRAVPIVEAMVAFVMAEALIEKLGGDSLQEMLRRYSSLKQLNLDDLALDGRGHIFWPEDDHEPG